MTDLGVIQAWGNAGNLRPRFRARSGAIHGQLMFGDLMVLLPLQLQLFYDSQLKDRLQQRLVVMHLNQLIHSYPGSYAYWLWPRLSQNQLIDLFEALAPMLVSVHDVWVEVVAFLGQPPEQLRAMHKAFAFGALSQYQARSWESHLGPRNQHLLAFAQNMSQEVGSKHACAGNQQRALHSADEDAILKSAPR